MHTVPSNASLKFKVTTFCLVAHGLKFLSLICPEGSLVCA